MKAVTFVVLSLYLVFWDSWRCGCIEQHFIRPSPSFSNESCYTTIILHLPYGTRIYTPVPSRRQKRLCSSEEMSLLVHSPFTMRPFQYSWIPLVTLLCFSSSFLTVLIFQNFSDRRCQTDSLAQHLLPDFNNQRSVAEVGESVASWGPEEAALMTDGN